MERKDLEPNGYIEINIVSMPCTNCGGCDRVEKCGNDYWTFEKTGLIFHRCAATLWRKRKTYPANPNHAY